MDTLGALDEAVAAREQRARTDHARLLQRDTTLWQPAAEVTGRWLGWLDSLDRAEEHLRLLRPIAQGVRDEGVEHVVLVGMGGSSLFPLVLSGACGSAVDHPVLHVLDSTDPAAVARVEASVDWEHTVVVASKSGTTVETLAHLDLLHERLTAAVGAGAGARIVVITDPGSPLQARAAADGYRAIVAGDVDVGGRYSALSPFGLLPAALLGVDLDELLGRARAAAARWIDDPWSDAGPACLGTLIACGVADGRDALHVVVDARAGMFGAWIEQLVAESSGKDGTGSLPVVVRSADDVVVTERAVVVAIGEVDGIEQLTHARVPLLRIPWSGCLELGAEVLRWMQAVPLACAQLGVDPFDQPDVASAKSATADALDQGSEPDAPVALDRVRDIAARAGYVAILAYVDPEGEVADRLADVAAPLARDLGVPVTVGIGPRYLHSTGQLHKGGRNDGVFLVVVGDDPEDVTIPGRAFGFARLKRAQAAGDIAALRGAGRHVAVTTPEELLGAV